VKQFCDSLEMIVNLLEKSGNKAEYVVRPHDSYEYVLEKPIDFKLLKNNFEVSSNILFDENIDVIFDRQTWAIIRGPNYIDS